MKAQILAALGETELGLAAKVSSALAANDRIKYYFALLQMAMTQAGGASGACVGFTRNPASGEREMYLDCRFNAPGEVVVAGRHRAEDRERLRRTLRAVWKQIESSCQTLEGLFRDAQDFEFTLQHGALYLLQSRDAKRTDSAALRIAVDLVQEGLIAPAEARRRLCGIDLAGVSRPAISAGFPAREGF